MRDRLQRSRIGDRYVVDVGDPALREMPPCNRIEADGAPLARLVSPVNGAQRSRERERSLARRRIEVAVAARHRETIGLADRRGHDDFDWNVEVSYHRADERRLLNVFLAEHRNMWLHDVEQLGPDFKRLRSARREARPRAASARDFPERGGG